jgi:hypothetical protein
MCAKINGFDSRARAEARAETIASQLGAPRMCAYWCGGCGRWCLTSRRRRAADVFGEVDGAEWTAPRASGRVGHHG